ncbi:hypothetical protein [Streptomyces sp. NPDC057428]|uniref:hypothetical protein n=1 Tax=Streptomyces sp. NPDC057428 TaxID=3346129 RepID=UPI0036BD5256
MLVAAEDGVPCPGRAPLSLLTGVAVAGVDFRALTAATSRLRVPPTSARVGRESACDVTEPPVLAVRERLPQR